MLNCCCELSDKVIPDRENTASLGQARLLADTTDPLLEDGRNLSGRGLGLSGKGPGLVQDSGSDVTGLLKRRVSDNDPAIATLRKIRQNADDPARCTSASSNDAFPHAHHTPLRCRNTSSAILLLMSIRRGPMRAERGTDDDTGNSGRDGTYSIRDPAGRDGSDRARRLTKGGSEHCVLLGVAPKTKKRGRWTGDGGEESEGWCPDGKQARENLGK